MSERGMKKWAPYKSLVEQEKKEMLNLYLVVRLLKLLWH